GLPHRIQRLSLVVVFPGRIFCDDRSLFHCSNALAWWMVAALSELAEWDSVGSDFLYIPRRYVLVFRSDLFLQHGAHAETSAIPHSNHRARGIRRRARF